ncbi:MAG: Mammalian cell entry related domain protein [Solirubrobacterales bacterium]|nr:Mammalian cell entry related domain protein [Solirubrobacterales bacterium]
MMGRFNRPVSHIPSPFTIVVAALLSVGLLVGLTLIAIVAPRGVPLLSYYDLDARFDNASEIADLSQVRIAGRHVGQVTGSSFEGGHAVVRMALYPGAKPLRSDTRARIRLNGLLGAKFVELIPGHHGRTLASGSTLPAKQTSTAVDLLTVLQAFDKPTRLRLQTTVRGLGEGFLGRGQDINHMLTVAPKFLGNVGTATGSVVARGGAAARFVPAAELLARAYDPVRGDLASGFAPEAKVLQAFVDKSTQVHQALDVAPASLESLRRGLKASTPLLAQTAGLARAAIALTGPAPAALRAASALLRDAGPALVGTKPALENLSAAVPSTLGFLGTVNPVISPAIDALHESLPELVALGQHSCDVLDFARNWRSTLGFGVATGAGPLAAGEPGLGPLNSLRVVAVRALTELEADAPQYGSQVHDTYPAPCTATKQRLR